MALKTPPAFDTFSAGHTTTPFAVYGRDGFWHYFAERNMAARVRLTDHPLFMLNRKTGEWETI